MWRCAGWHTCTSGYSVQVGTHVRQATVCRLAHMYVRLQCAGWHTCTSGYSVQSSIPAHVQYSTPYSLVDSLLLTALKYLTSKSRGPLACGRLMTGEQIITKRPLGCIKYLKWRALTTTAGNMLPAVQWHVAHGDIWNEKTSLNISWQSQNRTLKQLWKLKRYLFMQTYSTLLIHFVKNC